MASLCRGGGAISDCSYCCPISLLSVTGRVFAHDSAFIDKTLSKYREATLSATTDARSPYWDHTQNLHKEQYICSFQKVFCSQAGMYPGDSLVLQCHRLANVAMHKQAGVNFCSGTFTDRSYADDATLLRVILTAGVKCSLTANHQPTHWACTQTGRKQGHQAQALNLLPV